jgi:hypothetical protein
MLIDSFTQPHPLLGSGVSFVIFGILSLLYSLFVEIIPTFIRRYQALTWGAVLTAHVTDLMIHHEHELWSQITVHLHLDTGTIASYSCREHFPTSWWSQVNEGDLVRVLTDRRQRTIIAVIGFV